MLPKFLWCIEMNLVQKQKHDQMNALRPLFKGIFCPVTYGFDFFFPSALSYMSGFSHISHLFLQHVIIGFLPF